jgi:alcohol dehydrogenase (cytochrome c)
MHPKQTTRTLGILGTGVALVAATAWLHAQQITGADVTNGLANSGRWLTYSGDYTGQRHSPLTQMTPGNAATLRPEWTFQTGVTGHFEATPIVIDGVLYVTGPQDHAWAVDAATGRPIWHYQYKLPEGLKVCCGLVNRGFAVLGDRLFMSTLDAHLVALNIKDGSVAWDVPTADYHLGYASTGAPLIVKGRVIVGMAGGEYANRGFIDAYAPADGHRVWRFWTIPGPGEKGSETWPADVLARGGGPTWVTGTYDADLNLIYWGTGNPNPDWDGEHRPGDNLYTGSLVALDADTGALKWHYQFTPHDTHDWDANQVPVLADLTIAGRPRKVVMQANRNGVFYVLDRATGAFISGTPFVNTNWISGFDAAGRPNVVPGHDPTPQGTVTCPDWYGGTNFNSPSFDASRGLFFLTARETCATFIQRPTPDANVGDRTMGGTVRPSTDPKSWGALRAIDPATGQRKWEVRYDGAGWAGVLSTASGLVFSADNEGTFMAVDAATGRVLYRYNTGAPIYAAPTTFTVDGRQYVAVGAGMTYTAFAVPVN